MTMKDPMSANSSCTSGSSVPSYLVMALSGLLGGVSMALFVAFLYTGLPSQINLGLNEPTSLYFNTLLCFLFFLQHSLMLRNGFRQWLSGFIPPIYLGALFSIFSGLFLLILMLFWQKSTSIHIEIDGAGYGVMRVLFFISMISFYFTIRSLRSFDPLGIRDISIHLKGKQTRGSIFTVRGTYQWVRHPLYFFSLLMIWANVSLTTDRLLFNGLWTVWIIIGTFLEERDLIASFGDEYRNYQRKVPMLIPYKWFPWANNKQ
ncbi:MAG: hypothetical protein H8D87_03080 [Deltaproteobacteria bacterium]|uniref:methyltransferase family protein n=1 Tax=Desulfobacula sp. TaxID=2593537 RepID=UPI0019A9D987|nr:hypothetical protein [Candidatus Desulfobacula maris]MBL6993906.1 hypothetical protein [Desulfobacula sp.]